MTWCWSGPTLAHSPGVKTSAVTSAITLRRLGVYLSPRDDYFGANTGGICATPEKQEAYGRMYLQQLTELLTRYGEMCEVWFDGSNRVDVGDILAAHAPETRIAPSPSGSFPPC